MNLTDASGNKVASYIYKAFGELRSQSGSIANPWLFTARQLDTESGLYYYRNRYYDEGVGRFTTQDSSLTLNPHYRVIPYLLLNQLPNPLEVQRYLYCINNPINLVDPFGLEPGQNTRPWWMVIGGLTLATPFPGDEAAFWTGVGVVVVGSYAVHQFSKYHKKGPLWDAPGMPGDMIRRYNQDQPGAFKPPPNFKNWKDKIIWTK